MALLPVAGAVVGAISGTLALGAARALSPRVGAAVGFALPIALTGALHLDGFLDTCDAAFASVDSVRRREILRDPRHGSFAFAGGAIVAVATYAALRDIAPEDLPAALALSEALARSSALVVARFARRRAPPGTAARAFSDPVDDRALILQTTLILAGAHAYGGVRLAASASAIVATSVLAARWIARRFDGSLSGDAYGFIIIGSSAAMLCASA